MKRLLTLVMLVGLISSCNMDQNKTEPAKPNESLVEEMTSPTGDSCAEPYLFTDVNGSVYLSWVEKKGRDAQLKYSKLLNDKWTAPITIAVGNNWFVNWADYPMVSSDGNNNMVAHFLEKSASSTYAYDVRVVRSNDAGKSWSVPTILHDDGKQAEHGFVSMVPYNKQTFVSWLDGRNAAAEESGGVHGGHHGQMTLRGALVDTSGNKTAEWELDNRVCDCCQTSAAITDNGPVVVYRDRSDEEIRDMSIVRLVNGQWTSPKTVHLDNWKIEGCPVNGPRIAATGNKLAIAWFSMPEKNAQVNVVFSEDGGETFTQPIRIDGGKPIGRVDVVMLDDNSAMVSWMEANTIKALKVKADGSKEVPRVIASSSESRSSGFPQMTRSGNKIIFAWTDDKAKTVKVAGMRLSSN